MKCHDLAVILASHRAWLVGDAGGQRAHLAGADLSGADLWGAQLMGADLSRARLSGAHLVGADLTGADLSGADLSGADLSRAQLMGTDLSGANLSRTALDTSAPIPDATAALTVAGIAVRGGIVYAYRTARSTHAAEGDYETPGEYVAPWFSVDPLTDCHPGLYLASRDWLEREYPGCPLVGVRARVEDVLATVGGKFRARRFTSMGMVRA